MLPSTLLTILKKCSWSQQEEEIKVCTRQHRFFYTRFVRVSFKLVRVFGLIPDVVKGPYARVCVPGLG